MQIIIFDITQIHKLTDYFEISFIGKLADYPGIYLSQSSIRQTHIHQFLYI
jgi:predicted exporter